MQRPELLFPFNHEGVSWITKQNTFTPTINRFLYLGEKKLHLCSSLQVETTKPVTDLQETDQIIDPLAMFFIPGSSGKLTSWKLLQDIHLYVCLPS